MGAARAAAAAAHAGCAAPGRPAGTERHPVEAGNGSAVAGPARAVRSVAERGHARSALDARRRLGPARRRHPARGRRRRTPGLAGALRRWDRGPGAPACGRGKAGDAEAAALGRSRGGLTTKVQLRAEGGGQPMTLVLTPGQRHEATVFAPLREQRAVRRPGRGRPRLRPARIVGAKGYTGRAHRASCRRRGIRITIPTRRTERRSGPFDRAAARCAQSGRAPHRSRQAVPLPRHPL